MIVSKHIIENLSGGITVVEGDVMTERGKATFCWVERQGRRVSEFTDIDHASAIAEGLCEQD